MEIATPLAGRCFNWWSEGDELDSSSSIADIAAAEMEEVDIIFKQATEDSQRERGEGQS